MSRVLATALAASAAFGLAGCTSTAPPPSTPTAIADDYADRMWDTFVVPQYPDAARPRVDLVRYISRADAGRVSAECLTAEGFPSEEVDGGSFTPAVPPEQDEALQIAMFTCAVRYPPDPAESRIFDDEALSGLYDYTVGSLIPCLEKQGYDIDRPPSRSVFVQDFYERDVTPWSQVFAQETDDSSLDDLLVACPQYPPSLL